MNRTRKRQQARGMREIRLIFIFYCLLLLAFGLPLSGCGKKGDVQAPELVIPETIRNLTARQDKAGVALTWSRPTQYVDGQALKDLTSFVIFRKEIPPSCADCPVPYRPLTTVYVEDREKFIKQKQYRFIDEQVQSKATYRYRVSSQLKDGSLSEPSNEVEIVRGP
ncbi:MAG TPA: hypothetical protein VJ733_11765 [Candidatus Binatia bacterium]|nr:hypothetical protein [Candidatus Binatia bacterium]